MESTQAAKKISLALYISPGSLPSARKKLYTYMLGFPLDYPKQKQVDVT